MTKLVVTCLGHAAVVVAALTSATVLAQTTAHAQLACDADSLYRQGEEAYRRARYPEAATLLMDAYACEPDPALLFNAARAYDRARMSEQAIATYERYLASAPTAEARARAERAIDALRAEARGDDEAAQPEGAPPEAVSSQEVVTEPAVTRTPPVEPQHHGTTRGVEPFPWVLAALGAAGGAVALGLGALAESTAASASAASTHREGHMLAQDADTLALATNVVGGVAAALGAIGLVWGIVDLAITPRDDVRVALRGDGVLQLRASF